MATLEYHNIQQALEDSGGNKRTAAKALGGRMYSLYPCNVNGSDHPDVAWSLNNLAVLYKAQGRYDEALALSERAVGIMERVRYFLLKLRK